jgi:hypothetical protein
VVAESLVDEPFVVEVEQQRVLAVVERQVDERDTSRDEVSGVVGADLRVASR